MQFSTFALAAFLTATAQALCPPHNRGGHGSRPSAPPAYNWGWSAPPPAPTTLQTITSAAARVIPTSAVEPTPVVEPVPTVEPLPVVEPVPTVEPTPVVEPLPAVVPTPVEDPAPAYSAAEIVPTASEAPAAASPPPASDASLSTDQANALSAHNAARAEVGVADLVWDASLASAAQVWADQLATGSPGTLEHDTQSGQGENLYWSSQVGDPYDAASAAWISEKSLYNGEAITGGGSFESYGHYTQIIWDTTTHVGMAISDDGAGGTYVVARYSPPGNMIGETPTST